MEIKDLFKILIKNKWIIFSVALFTLLFSLIVSVLKPAVYESQAILTIKDDPLATILTEINAREHGVPNEDSSGKASMSEAVRAFVEFLESREYKIMLLARYRQKNLGERGILDDKIMLLPDIPPESKDTVLVKFQGLNFNTNKKISKFFKETIVQDYKQQLEQHKREALALIEEQIGKSNQKINELEARIPSRIIKFKYMNLYDYLKEQDNLLRSLKLERSKSLISVNSNIVVIKLRDRIAELRQELARAPRSSAKQKELAQVLDEAEKRLQITLFLLQGKTNLANPDYFEEIGKLESELDYLNRYEKDIRLKLDAVKNESERLTKLLDFKEKLELVQRYKELEITEIKGPFHNSIPINKDLQKVITLSIFLGVLLGVFIALFNSYLQPEPLAKENILASKNLFWGSIQLKKNLLSRGKFSLTENLPEYQLVRTQMLFDLKDKKGVYAAIDLSGREGYTQIFPKLAVSLAKIGQKVLMIDTDFQKGISLAVKKGLKDLLSGELPVEELNKILIRSEQHSQVELLPSGGQIDNPADLLAKDTFRQLINQLKSSYDYIFVLTTNNLASAELFIVSKEVDQIICLLQPAVTSREEYVEANHKLKKFNKNPLGIIFYSC